MSEGKVVEWLKKVGDFVEAGEALMVVESDKANMDVEAFEDGYVALLKDNTADKAPLAELEKIGGKCEEETAKLMGEVEKEHGPLQ